MNSNNTGDRRPVCLVTGASRGIGKAIAKAFAEAGYDLVLTCSKTLPELEAFAKELEGCSAASLDAQGAFANGNCQVNCQTYQVDASDPAQVQALFQKISRLDVLVNNAGISYVGLLHEMTVDEWHRVLSTNLDSCFYTSKFAIPLMLQNHAGKIINISSVWGNIGASTEVAYSASKGGVNAFTKALAKELAPSNVQVNAIACGVIDTSMNACFSAEDMEALKAEIPADRIGDPSEVAKLALQLATAPSYLTGQVITMDGGWT